MTNPQYQLLTTHNSITHYIQATGRPLTILPILEFGLTCFPRMNLIFHITFIQIAFALAFQYKKNRIDNGEQRNEKTTFQQPTPVSSFSSPQPLPYLRAFCPLHKLSPTLGSHPRPLLSHIWTLNVLCNLRCSVLLSHSENNKQRNQRFKVASHSFESLMCKCDCMCGTSVYHSQVQQGGLCYPIAQFFSSTMHSSSQAYGTQCSTLFGTGKIIMKTNTINLTNLQMVSYKKKRRDDLSL